MADGSGIDFGLSALNNAFSSQATLQANRQKEEESQAARARQASNDKLRIAQASSDITQGLVADLSGLAAQIDSNEQAAAQQAELFSSGNPLDFVTAIGNQITDPAKYTRAGRAQATAEIQQNVNARTFIASTQQTALQNLQGVVDAKLAAGSGPLDQAALLEKQGMERIESEKLRIASQANQLQQANAMQDAALAQMDSTQIKAASEKAGGKPINIGGVEISPGKLQDRVQQINDRDMALENHAMAIAANKLELAKKNARKSLETMSLVELRPMLQNGDPNGVYDLSDIKQVYDMKSQAQSDEISRTTQMMQLGDMASSTILPAADQVDRMTPQAPKGTPLAGAIQDMSSTVAMAANIVQPFTSQGKPVPFEVAKVANDAIKAQQDEVEKTIQSQATLMSKGDKDMKELYVERFRGNPLPAASVESAIQTRLEKNNPLTDVLPAETATRVKQLYAEKVQKLTSAAQMGGIGSVDKESIRRQAMQEAIQEGIGADVKGRTEDMLGGQVAMAGHPLAGKVSSSELLSLVAKADSDGKQHFQTQFGLDDQEMQTVLSGGQVKGVGLSDLAFMQNQEFLFSLDTIESGLAGKYVGWWRTQGDAYTGKMLQGRQASALQGGLQNQAFETYAAGQEESGYNAYKQGIMGAADSYRDAKREKYHQMISFDGKPEYRQATLLQMDGTLTDSEKQTFTKNFVQPLINLGYKQNLSYDETNTIIEQAIDSGIAEDPTTQKILNKVVKNRATTMRNLDSITQQPWYQPMDLMGMMGIGRQNRLNGVLGRVGVTSPNSPANRDYSWYHDLMKETSRYAGPTGTQSVHEKQ